MAVLPSGPFLLLACFLLVAAVSGKKSHFENDLMKMKMLRTYFNCPPCDISQCPKPIGCAEVVKESGICGCCYTCALGEGEMCGMYTKKCGEGLACRPVAGTKGLDSLMMGSAACVRKESNSVLGKFRRSFLSGTRR